MSSLIKLWECVIPSTVQGGSYVSLDFDTLGHFLKCLKSQLTSKTPNEG